MMNEENNIDKLFRDKLEGISENPPAYVWDGVKEKLAWGRKTRRSAWFSWAAVAALLVLAFVAGWYFNESSEELVPQTVEQTVENPAAEDSSANKNVASEPVAGETNNPVTDKNAEFFADAEGMKSTGRKIDAHDVLPSDPDNGELMARIEITPFEKIKPVQATLKGTIHENADDKKQLAGKTNILSAFDKEIIERNATAYTEVVEDNTGWRMGVNVSPGYSSHTAKYGTDYASNMTQAANEGNANMSGGITIRYRTSKRWSVESGVYYAQNGKQAGSTPEIFASRAELDNSVAPERLYFNTAVKMENHGVAMNSIAGIIDIESLPAGAEIAADLENAGFYGNSLITQGEISQVFDLVEIPLYLRYLLVESKLDVEILGGINAGVIVGNHAFLDNQFGVQRIGKTRDISAMNVSGTVGVGFNYALGKHFSLGLEPRFNYYMNSISRNPEVDFRPYRLGLYTGLYYSF